MIANSSLLGLRKAMSWPIFSVAAIFDRQRNRHREQDTIGQAHRVEHALMVGLAQKRSSGESPNVASNSRSHAARSEMRTDGRVLA